MFRSSCVARSCPVLQPRGGGRDKRLLLARGHEQRETGGEDTAPRVAARRLRPFIMCVFSSPDSWQQQQQPPSSSSSPPPLRSVRPRRAGLSLRVQRRGFPAIPARDALFMSVWNEFSVQRGTKQKKWFCVASQRCTFPITRTHNEQHHMSSAASIARKHVRNARIIINIHQCAEPTATVIPGTAMLVNTGD